MDRIITTINELLMDFYQARCRTCQHLDAPERTSLSTAAREAERHAVRTGHVVDIKEDQG